MEDLAIEDQEDELATQGNGEHIIPAAPTLLSIPQELRDQIYNHLLVEDAFLHFSQGSRFSRAWIEYSANAVRVLSSYKALTQTCRQLLQEVRPHFWENNVTTIHNFTSDIFKDCLEPFPRHVRHLALWRGMDIHGRDGREIESITWCALRFFIKDGTLSCAVGAAEWKYNHEQGGSRDSIQPIMEKDYYLDRSKEETAKATRVRNIVEGRLERAMRRAELDRDDFGILDVSNLRQLQMLPIVMHEWGMA